jgi:hypothetical protein
MYFGSKALTDIALLLSSFEGENAFIIAQDLGSWEGLP